MRIISFLIKMGEFEHYKYMSKKQKLRLAKKYPEEFTKQDIKNIKTNPESYTFNLDKKQKKKLR